MRRERGPTASLRNSIDAMPYRSKVAMLQGMDENRIIAGAYVDGNGGVCPMLAAHRTGGRTSLSSFAKAWDRYTDASRARRASARELRTLRALLEESLATDAGVNDEQMRAAVADHKLLVARRTAAETPEPTRVDTGDRDRSEELAGRTGWAWSRLFRRYDHYEAALKRLEELQAEHPELHEGEPAERVRTPVG